MNLSRVCTTCNVEKTLDMFGARKRGKDGKQSKCKACLKDQFFEMQQKKHKEYSARPKVLTKEDALFLFDYIDGSLYWKNPTHGKAIKGSKAGFINELGYYQISIYGKKFREHQIIYLMNHGYIPKEIDHINGNKIDNRIENLREVTRMQNMYNKPAYKCNKSGSKNVSWKAKINKWQVAISYEGKRKYLGVFDDFEFAELVATEARNKYHGKYANHNIGV